MAFLIIRSSSKNDEGAKVEASDGTYTVKIVNVNEKAGSTTIGIKNGDAYDDTNQTRKKEFNIF